jgi:hypothetical protein
MLPYCIRYVLQVLAFKFYYFPSGYHLWMCLKHAEHLGTGGLTKTVRQVRGLVLVSFVIESKVKACFKKTGVNSLGESLDETPARLGWIIRT